MFTQEKFETIFAKVKNKFDSSPKEDDKVSFSNGISIEVQKFLETLKHDESEKFSIGKNGLYLAFRSAKDICKQLG